MFAQTQTTIQQQCLGFTHWPDHCFHRVSTQLLERRDALVPINHYITVWLMTRDHHDRDLLSRFGQRGKQPPLPSRMACPQVLPSPVELVKLQSHATLWGRASVWGRPDRVLRCRRGKWTGNSRAISYMRTELVFRGAHQECAHNRNEIRAFPPELVFRQIPG